MPATSPTSTATETPEHLEVFELHEATLTAELNAGLAGQPLGETFLGPATVRDLHVQLRDGRMRIAGTARAGLLALPLDGVATVRVQDGRPVANIEQVTVGGWPIPEPARQQFERAIQARVDEEMVEQRLTLRAIRIEDGRITLVGTRR